jgi:hypothetical protein
MDSTQAAVKKVARVDERSSQLRSLLARPELWITLIVLIAGAYFCGSGSWNQNARLDAIFSFVEPGPHRWTFRIDPFLPFPDRSVNTGDWTRIGEHYYANKAPGTILLGVLAYLPLHWLEAALDVSSDEPMIEILNAYWINVWVSVVPLALASALWYRLLSRQVSAQRAVALTLCTFFATALFPYSTQLWGHTTAAGFVMMAWWSSDAAAGSPRRLPHVATGALAGLAVLCDFLAFPAALALVLGAGLKRGTRLGWLCVGGLGPVLLLLGYQWYCFGSPWSLPTEHTRSQFVDTTRVLGLFGWVDPTALLDLTLGPRRGLFFQMPLLLAAAVGYVFWFRRARFDFEPWANASAFILTLALVASFNGWHGGATVCARYLIPATPLLARGLAALPSGRWATVGLAALAVPSSCNMLAVAAVGPLAPDTLANPLRSFIYPHFLAGRLHPYPWPIRLQALHPDFSAWSQLTVWNFGDVLGLTGLARLLPLVTLIAGASFLAIRLARSSREPSKGIPVGKS